MRRERGQRVQIIQREIAIADGIQAIGRNARKSQLPRQRRAIQRKCANRPARPSPAGRSRPSPRGSQPLQIAKKSLRMRQQKMRKQQRLRVLQVRHARPWARPWRARRDPASAPIRPAHAARHLPRRILDEQPKIRGHQLVAAARRCAACSPSGPSRSTSAISTK